MKDTLIKAAIGCFVLLVLPVTLRAQLDSLRASDFIIRATSYGIGYASVFDTYLSPQEYKGIDYRISRETMRLTSLGNGNISAQTFFQANIAYTHNRADNNNTFSGLVNWSYGLHRQFRVGNNLKILAGGLSEINGGFVYNLRNSNNPASARAYINLDVSGMVIWHTRIKNFPVTLRYQANVPVAGVMFSPHYGQSYYEIFTLGNSDGVIRFVSLHNQPSIRQWFTFDFPVRKSTLRFSYLWDMQQSNLNGIRTHTYGHVFMIGFVKELYRIRKKSKTSIPAAFRAY